MQGLGRGTPDVVALKEHAVCGQNIAGVKQHHIAHDQLPRVDLLRPPISQHRHLRSHGARH